MNYKINILHIFSRWCFKKIKEYIKLYLMNLLKFYSYITKIVVFTNVSY